MNKLSKTTTALICFAFLNAPAFAEEKGPAAPPPPGAAHEGMVPSGEMGGMGMPEGMSEEQIDARLRQMQEHMLKMHDYMHQIRDAKDEKERQRLKDEQLKTMKEHMKAMHGHRRMMMQPHMPMMPGAPAPGDKPKPQ